MKKNLLVSFLLFLAFLSNGQSVCTPEFLWGLGRVNGHSLSSDGKQVYYSVSKTTMATQKNSTTRYVVPLFGGESQEIKSFPEQEEVQAIGSAQHIKRSPDGKKAIVIRSVKIDKVLGTDLYPSYTQSDVKIYDQLNYRHWDTWEDGEYDHPFIADIVAGTAVAEKDILKDQAFDCPTKPFGGEEDYIFSPDSKQIIYVTKKKTGTQYAESTNTDLYLYDIETEKTSNLTANNLGYDMNPVFNKSGTHLAYTQMKRDGFESDKNDLILMDWATKKTKNLSGYWDESVSSFFWGEDNETIFFIAAWEGTMHLFKVNIYNSKSIEQVSRGNFDIRGIVGQSRNLLVVHRGDMNQATELYTINILNGEMRQLSHVNDAAYASIDLPKVESRQTKLLDGSKLFSWVMYPPNFDPNKKYPVLLYCQGGPQGALSQFYSLRWNFQLMASQGYIIIAPNRTGMPGWGTEWNEQISGDWGGLAMDHYLAAVDDISNESYVDAKRIGAVGASYGGYSVFMLAGIHQKRFKTFIAHCGLFDLPSWYGTTEELFFANWDIGGPYWEYNNKKAMNSYERFSPSSYVQNWNTPMLIFQGGKDYRVPIEQGLQAFQAAQLKGLKSRLVYLPEENHWVLSPQNAMVWQKEFFRWLKETL